MDKNKLLKYGQYLKESIDPWKLKQGIKSFNRLPDDILTIHGDLKNLSDELTKNLIRINLPYNKLINFGGIEVDIKIIQSNKYYSNVDWVKFLSGDIEIVIEVKDDYDINYVVSMIIHEIRHMIDFTDENLNSGLSSFDIDRNLRKYNIDKFNEFFTLVYISLEHELVARNNQIYPYIKFKNLSEVESLEILKSSFIWRALEDLNSFDYKQFIDKFDKDTLTLITNEFIKDCLYDEESKVDDPDDLLQFYKTWSDYFKETSDKWKKVLMTEVNKIYERKTINIENSLDYKNIITDIWINIKNNKQIW
jgi:hypothetical protein